MDENLQTALAAAQIFDQLEVRWFLGGSLASSLQGIPRSTLDTDIIADIHSSHVHPLLKALGDAWYADERAMREAINSRSSFNIIHLDTGMKVDVFVPKLRRFDSGQFTRARRSRVAEESSIEMPVCAAEDIVAAKLEWYRLGGEISDRQWGDIMGVLRANAGRLDQSLMRESAVELGVADLLVKACAEADLTG